MGAKCQKGVCFDIELLPRGISRGRSVVATPPILISDLRFRIYQGDFGFWIKKLPSLARRGDTKCRGGLCGNNLFFRQID